MTGPSSAEQVARFRFSERAEPFQVRDAAPHVQGYAWRHSQPAASLVLVHGLQSHAQWFADAADELVERGFSVYALDRRGSGSSPEARGDIARYQDWFDEIGDVVGLARQESPDAPVHLVGHCFGANLALGYALVQPDDVQSVVMLTPGFYVIPDYPLRQKLRIAAAGLIAPDRKFRVPQDDELFTRDPGVLSWISRDTLGAKWLTARCLLQINRMLGWLRRGAGNLRVPLLVLEAGRDRLSDNRRNRELLEGELGSRAQVVSFDAEHFLLAEPCADDVLDELTQWAKHDPPQRRKRGPISVAGIDVLTAELPFRFSFGHALADRRSSTNVFVRVRLEDGTVGYGEGVPREYVTGETVEGALEALCERQVPVALGRSLSDPDDVVSLIDEIPGVAPDGSLDTAARCAIELALLDAAGKHFGLSVAHWLGEKPASSVHYDVVLPFSSPRKVAALALVIRALGVRQVKAKVGGDLEKELESLRILRRVLGDSIDLRVDANCAWTADEALEAIARLRPHRISAVEQPVAGDDLDGLRRVTAATEEAIIVDESLRTLDEARELASAAACDAFNIRVSKCGGLLNSVRIASVAAENGLFCVVGAQVGESGILSAAGRHLAAQVRPRYLEGSGGRLLLKQDVTKENVLPGRRGRARTPLGAGLGVEVQPGVLELLGTVHQVFEAGTVKA